MWIIHATVAYLLCCRVFKWSRIWSRKLTFNIFHLCTLFCSLLLFEWAVVLDIFSLFCLDYGRWTNIFFLHLIIVREFCECIKRMLRNDVSISIAIKIPLLKCLKPFSFSHTNCPLYWQNCHSSNSYSYSHLERPSKKWTSCRDKDTTVLLTFNAKSSSWIPSSRWNRMDFFCLLCGYDLFLPLPHSSFFSRRIIVMTFSSCESS